MMDRYSKGAIALHWLLAAAIAVELILGFMMPRDASGFAAFQLHKSIGIAILALSILRLAWRLWHPLPPPIGFGAAALAARAVHTAFYIFLIGAPLTGWLVVSTSNQQIPTVLFGLIPWPHLPVDAGLNETAEMAHLVAALLGIALLAAHLAGVLRHELFERDGTLARMSPRGSRIAGVVLAIAVLMSAAVTYQALLPTAPPAAALAAQPEPKPRSQDTVVVEASNSASNEPSPAAEPLVPVWHIAPGGRLQFAVGNGAGGTVNGQFASWRGTIMFDPDHPETAEIRIEVDLSSVSVGDATQDAMLAGSEYFDVAGSREAVFTTRTVRRISADRYTADGVLEMKGMRRPLALAFTLEGAGLRRKVTGSTSIARSDFALGSGESGTTLAPVVIVSFSFAASRNVDE